MLQYHARPKQLRSTDKNWDHDLTKLKAKDAECRKYKGYTCAVVKSKANLGYSYNAFPHRKMRFDRCVNLLTLRWFLVRTRTVFERNSGRARNCEARVQESTFSLQFELLVIASSYFMQSTEANLGSLLNCEEPLKTKHFR